ncbi:MAG: hypothetical protein AMJ79_05365 [Phycisphaerae bacterium SM23_30]|nr:MAG: hypothetical protein AMJ79_05365 [Phycisphaerae bacterium SM23_30]
MRGIGLRHLLGGPRSSIGRKQVVAGTGVLMLAFVIVHLIGNMLILRGEEVFNGYAAKLAGLGFFLYLMEIGLILIALIHIFTALTLAWENCRARGKRYLMSRPAGELGLSARLMPITGLVLLSYVIFHLCDFKFAELGPRSMVGSEDMGLYGMVYNSFQNPVHAGVYIFAMLALGLHLNHAIQSALQTFGLNNERFFPFIKKISLILGIIIALLYILIPVVILLNIIKT